MANGPTLVVMAAGLGSRFGGAKQFFELGPAGETLADYSLYDAWRAGFSRAVFIVRPEDEALIQQRYGARWKSRLAVETALQRLDDLPGGRKPPADRTKPWGTAHAVWCARKQVDGPFACINADDFYGRSAFETMGRTLSENPEQGALIGYALGQTLSPSGTVARAVCEVGRANMLKRLIECRKIRETAGTIVAEDHSKLDLDRGSLVSMNFWGLPARSISFFEDALADAAEKLSTDWSQNQTVDKSALFQEEFALPDLISRLIDDAALQVRLLPIGRDWIGVTYREDAAAASARLAELGARGAYPRPVWADAGR